MNLIFDYKMFRHINESAVKEKGRASRVLLFAESILKRRSIIYPLAIFEHSLGFLLRLPIPVYSSIIYWIIANARGLPYFLGMYFRALYYRGKLGGMEPNVFIDQNVFFAHPKSVFLSEFSYIDKYVTIMSRTAKVGRRVHIAPRVFVSGGGDFVIEDYACIATNSNIITSTEVIKNGARCSGPMVSASQRDVFRGTVTIKRDAFIGANVTILPGVTVEEGSVAGAGITLSKDTESWSIYAYPRAKKVADREPVRGVDD